MSRDNVLCKLNLWYCLLPNTLPLYLNMKQRGSFQSHEGQSLLNDTQIFMLASNWIVCCQITFWEYKNVRLSVFAFWILCKYLKRQKVTNAVRWSGPMAFLDKHIPSSRAIITTKLAEFRSYTNVLLCYIQQINQRSTKITTCFSKRRPYKWWYNVNKINRAGRRHRTHKIRVKSVPTPENVLLYLINPWRMAGQCCFQMVGLIFSPCPFRHGKFTEIPQHRARSLTNSMCPQNHTILSTAMDVIYVIKYP